MLVGYMRVSSNGDRQTTLLQRDALLAAGVDDRHLYEDKASGARADRLGRSLPHLLSIVTGLRERGVAFRSLTEQMDTTTPHGELLFSIFGALAQYERALTQERVRAGLAAAKRRGRHGGRPPEIGPEKLEAIIAALNGGATKAAVCRTFGAKRTTLIETLDRAGWSGPGTMAARKELGCPSPS